MWNVTNIMSTTMVQVPPKPIKFVVSWHEVGIVLDSTIMRNTLNYLMDWLTYILIDDTWDIAKNIDNAQALVAKFTLTHLD